MACVTACPSGVRYDELIEATRSQVERNHVRARGDRAFRGLVFWLFPHPRRLRVAAVLGWLYQRLGLAALVRRSGITARLPPRLAALESLLPPVRLRDLRRRFPVHVAPRSPQRLRVGLLTGCVQSVFFAEVNRATARVLATEGCEVVAPAGQGCCGALEVHSGREPEALVRARALIAEFETADVDRVVVNAAGCGSTLKEYDRLLADDPDWADRAAAFTAKVRDVMELLDELGPVASRHPIAARVAYHDACHLAHAQGVRSQPRAVLAQIPDLVLAELGDGERCCGSAGIYNLTEPEAAAELGRRKAATITDVDPEAVVTANPGCILQLRRHLPRPLPVLHPVQVLDASLRGIDPFTPAVRG
jgi:glycolate oxidase iron-sulfur subunit